MEDDFFDIAELISKYMAGELTEEERGKLEDWLSISEENKSWFDVITEDKFILHKRQELKSIDVKEGWKELSRKRFQKNRKRMWRQVLRYACVFVFLVVVGVCWKLLDVGISSDIPVVHSEIIPGSSKAMLYMANGSVIDLGMHERDTIREQDGTTIQFHGKSITYGNVQDSVAEMTDLFNELVIPRGGEYVVVLPDGTAVCLNAESKLRYPTRFSGTTRRVELEGEGYFQVTYNAEKPFVVEASGMEITVLGTEFNVSNYPENEDVQATLIRGKVKVSYQQDEESYVLQPGEQAVLHRESGKMTILEVDVSYVVAWKEGRLRFRDRPLKEIMDFISKWYDVEVIYEDEEVKNYLFGCNFNRHATVEPLLELFQSTGTVHFKIEGKRVVVKK